MHASKPEEESTEGNEDQQAASDGAPNAFANSDRVPHKGHFVDPDFNMATAFFCQSKWSIKPVGEPISRTVTNLRIAGCENSVPDRSRKRGRIEFAVGNADQHIVDSTVVADRFGDSTKLDKWFTTHLVDDLDIGPLDALRPARAHRFEDGFFGGPPPCEMLNGCLPLRAVGDLAGGEDASNEGVVVLFDHVRNAAALDDVRSNSDDVIHAQEFKVNVGQFIGMPSKFRMLFWLDPAPRQPLPELLRHRRRESGGLDPDFAPAARGVAGPVRSKLPPRRPTLF